MCKTTWCIHKLCMTKFFKHKHFNFFYLFNQRGNVSLSSMKIATKESTFDQDIRKKFPICDYRFLSKDSENSRFKSFTENVEINLYLI